MAEFSQEKRFKVEENESFSGTEVLLNDSKIPYILTVSPVIIENIFKFLPARDLGSCAIVCSVWNGIAVSMKKKRRTISFIVMHELAEEKFLLETLLKCWSEPNLAIVFGALGVHIDVELDIFNTLRNNEYLLQYNGKDDFFQHIYGVDLQEILSSMRNVRTCLPKKCHFIRVPVRTFYKMSSDQTVTFDSKTTLIIPSLPGVEMGAFSFNHTDINFEMGKFYVPKLTACDSSETELKCILLFTSNANNIGTLEKDILTNTSLEKRISDKTVIAGGKVVCLPVITGITFTGEVDIECFCLTSKKCCTISLLTGLKELGFQNKTGIAFLLSTFISQKFTCSLFQELFPNFFLLGVVCEDDGLLYPSGITNTSVKQCNLCEALLGTHEHKVSPSVVVIFVMFQKVLSEVIKL